MITPVSKEDISGGSALPYFKYHPDPISTGSIAPSSAACQCCEKIRGYLYAYSFYCVASVESICPWCIADGSAATKFSGTFVDLHSLASAGISREIIEIVTKRTPGYCSWQPEAWQSCCNDACEFHGDASEDDVRHLSLSEMQRAIGCEDLDEEYARGIVRHYKPTGNPAFYKWKCRHCGAITFTSDYL